MMILIRTKMVILIMVITKMMMMMIIMKICIGTITVTCTAHACITNVT